MTKVNIFDRTLKIIAHSYPSTSRRGELVEPSGRRADLLGYRVLDAWKG